MYRTLFFRYMSQSKHAEARELMYSGALLFFSHGQQNSAADLSMLVLESLEKAEVEVADELLENLAKVFSLMDPNSPERVAFVSRALKWSSGGSGKLGHPVCTSCWPSPCGKNKTIVSRGIIFCTRQTGRLCQHAGGILHVPRLPQRGGHVRGPGRATVSLFKKQK